jgi:hypothetical protein
MRQLETQTGAEKGSTMASTRTHVTWRKTFFLVFSIGALVASFAFAGGASAMRETAATAPTIVSDQIDYAPGETVTLTGANWLAGESVQIVVNDSAGQTWNYSAGVTADDAGNFTNQFQLPNSFIANYTATATGTSGAVATTTFTDGTLRFTTSGPTFSGTWTKHLTSNCSGPQGGVSPTTGTGPVTTNPGGTLSAGAVSGEWVKITAPATAGTPTQNFQSWTGPGGFSQTGQSLCVQGVDTGQNTYQANYASPPSVTTTSVGSISATTSTFGGTTNLSATVSPSGAPGSVAFFVAGSTTAAAGTVTYNSSTGVATLSNYAHGLNASTTAYGVRAVFTSSSSSFSNSEATNSSALTVNKKPVTITPTSGQSKVYGASDPELSFSNDGGLVAANFTGALSWAGGSNVGSYAINLGTLSAGGNYDLSLSATPVNFAITKKELLVNANDLSRVYGSSTPAASASFSGFITGENAGNVTINGAAVCTIDSGAGPNVGTYNDAIECGPGTLSAANYSFATGSKGKLTITPKPVTVTPTSGQSKVYGAGDPALTYGHSPALESGDGFTGGLGRAAGSNVGSYAINLGDLSAGDNYTLSLSTPVVNFAITKKQLLVNANDLSRVYGSSSPAASASFSGFISGENAGNVTITGDANCSIDGGAGPNVGTYNDAIECAPGTLLAANYSFATGSKGKLTITKADQTIALPVITNKALGSLDFDPGATASSGLAVSYAASPASFCTIVSGNVHVVAIGACTVTASQDGNLNYNPAPNVSRTFNVIYAFNGFFQPVDMDKINVVQAGSAIPIKFNLSGDQGLNIFAAGWPKVSPAIACDPSIAVDAIEETVTAGGSSLSYGAGQYIYVWKTDKPWASSCRRLDLKFVDGQTKSAMFQFKK